MIYLPKNPNLPEPNQPEFVDPCRVYHFSAFAKVLPTPLSPDGEALLRRTLLRALPTQEEQGDFVPVQPDDTLESAMERSTIFNGKIHYFDWAIFNSELLVYQRVPKKKLNLKFDHWNGLVQCI